MKHHFPDVPISNVLRLEGIANRDSLSYADTYGLGKLDELRTVLRGTLRYANGYVSPTTVFISRWFIRYPGFADLVHSFKLIGLLDADTSSHVLPQSWTDLTRLALGGKMGERAIPTDPYSFAAALSNIIPDQWHREHVWEALHWFGIAPSPSVTSGSGTTSLGPSSSRAASTQASALPPLPTEPRAPIDLLTAVLAHKLKYEPGERDLVVLAHEVVVARPSAAGAVTPNETEVYTSSLVAYGTPRASAMSRCVGLPVAFATLAVLDGHVVGRGVQGPTEETLYRAILDGLQGTGLEMKEGLKRGSGMEERLSDGLRSKGLTRNA